MSSNRLTVNKNLRYQYESNGVSNMSLLKIESVVPRLTNRYQLNKQFVRSYSTLTSSSIVNVKSQRKKSAIHHKKEKIRQLEVPRSDQLLNGNTTAKTGIITIKRTLFERDKLPDRINLDKKGLTKIPYIDDEPNLRLLSLQHNLINILYIPRVKTSEANERDGKHESPENLDSEQLIVLKPNQLPVKRATPPKSATSATKQNLINGKSTNQSTKANAPLTNDINRHSATALRGQNRFTLRKSNSFINGNTQRIRLGNLMETKATNLLSSFSSDTNSLPADVKITSSSSSSQIDLNIVQTVKLSTTGKGVAAQTSLEQQMDYFATSLQNLVFLDLYDNQIEKISNLDGLKNLAVLLLGKNRIKDISGIVSVKNTLRVLDLHGNRITSITNRICHLQELKSLNLAGNLLKQVATDDFSNLINLKELNLKRNRIKKINGFNDLINLERFWICHNDLQKVEDMWAIAKAINLKEVTIENNPVSLAGDCVSFLVSYLPNLLSLSQMQITEQVRRAAMAWRKSKELANTVYSSLTTDVNHNIRREEVISNARTNWELMRSQQPVHMKSNLSKSIKTNLPLNEDGESTMSVEVTQKKIVRQKSCVPEMSGRLSSKKISSLAAVDRMKQDFFRLPPILVPFLESQDSQSKKQSGSSTGSSLGPNVDSSSCYSSDNEDTAADPQVIEEINTDNKDLEKLSEDYKDEPEKLVEVEVKITTEVKQSVLIPGESVTCETNTEVTTIQTTTKEVKVEGDYNSSLSVNSIKIRAESPVPKTPKFSRTPSVNKRAPLVRAQTARGTCTSTGCSQNNAAKQKPVIEREREQGSDYLIEICGRYLNVYGIGALRFIDKQWNVEKANDVHTIKFNYINFNNIASILYKVKVRFPNAENFQFRDTNITTIGQLNALAEIQGISSLIIEEEGNSIFEKSWRSYAIYRLSHWGLKTINGQEVTDDELDEANQSYSGLSDLVLWSLPDSLLEPLLAKLRLNETCIASKLSPKDWLMKSDVSLKTVVGKEALQWKKCNCLADELELRQRVKDHFSYLIKSTCDAIEKLQKVETIWPQLLTEIIRSTLLDYAQMEVYIKNLLSELTNT